MRTVLPLLRRLLSLPECMRSIAAFRPRRPAKDEPRSGADRRLQEIDGGVRRRRC